MSICGYVCNLLVPQDYLYHPYQFGASSQKLKVSLGSSLYPKTNLPSLEPLLYLVKISNASSIGNVHDLWTGLPAPISPTPEHPLTAF